MEARLEPVVVLMRIRGVSTTRIANHLGLNPDSVKTWCRRQNVTPDPNLEQVTDPLGVWCRWCGNEIKVGMGMRQPSFCSTRCRQTWWYHHPETSPHAKTITCAGCGNSFTTAGSITRKYCSFDCYMTARFAA